MRFNVCRVKWFVASYLLIVWVGCMGDPSSRFEAQFELGRAVVREGLQVRFEPGASPRVDADGRLVSLHASGPTATLTIDHGPQGWSELDIGLDNVFVNGSFVPIRTSLGSRDIAGCPEEPDPAGFVLGPLVPDPERSPERLFAGLRLASCSRLEVRVMPPGTLGRSGFEPIRLAVIGEIKGDYDVLSRFREAIGSPPSVDLVVALGNVANSGEWLELERWREAMSQLGVPVVTAIGQDEALAKASLPFHEIFGRTDFDFSIGDVEFFVMDTASAGLASEQEEYWEGVLQAAEGQVRLVFMQIPPFDPSGTRDRGFVSRHQAARLVELLGRARVDAVFTGGVGTYALRYFGQVPYHSTGGGGGPLELGDDWGHHFLRVRIQAGDEVPVAVEVEAL